MGSIHYLPTTRDSGIRMLERAVTQAIASHRDPRVAALWGPMARDTLTRWSGPPVPSSGRLDVAVEKPLADADRQRVIAALTAWTDSYFGDVCACMMEMHREILTLQQRVAELEVERASARTRDD